MAGPVRYEVTDGIAVATIVSPPVNALSAALRAARLVHVVTFALFVAYGLTVDAGAWWYAGLALTAVAFVLEHRMVRADDLSRVNRAFFTVNGFIGLALLGFGVADLVARGLGA